MLTAPALIGTSGRQLGDRVLRGSHWLSHSWGQQDGLGTWLRMWGATVRQWVLETVSMECTPGAVTREGAALCPKLQLTESQGDRGACLCWHSNAGT